MSASRNRRNDEISAVIREHLEDRIADLVDRGLPRAQAERTARREFGNVALIEERCREVWGWPKLESAWADVVYALRRLRKSVGFTITAVLVLALGIGANTAMFTVVDSILLRPLPFPSPDRLMRIGYGGGQDNTAFFPAGWLQALGEHSTSFSSVSGFGSDAESNVGDANSLERVPGAAVTANALQTLAVSPALGRFFSPDNARAGNDAVVVLGYGYWRERFGGSPAALGASLRIDGISRQVIGVLPPNIHFPYADTQFLIPVAFPAQDPLAPWQNFNLRAFGRLKSGIAPAQAQAELRRLQPALLPSFPWRMPDIWANQMTVVPLLESEVGALRPEFALLFAAVGLILLIACANVANLMLAHAAGRERELAIRGALGASAGRLMRQLLAESVVLGLMAGVLGLLAALANLHAIASWLPADTPRLSNLALRGPVYLFTAGAALLAGLLSGLIPALKLASPKLGRALQAGSRGLTGGAGQFRAATLLVVAQIALSVLVISAAALVLHSLWKLSRVNPGFQTAHIVTAEVSLDASACGRQPSQGRCASFFESLRNGLQSLPAADGVALTDALPLDARVGNFAYDADGHPRQPRQGALIATARTVSPGYFAALGVDVLQGRPLQLQDESGATHAVVVNQALAQHLWPHESPLGRRLEDVNDEPQPTVWDPAQADIIVGVVANTREESLAGGFGDEVFLPFTPARQNSTMYVLLRTRAPMPEAAASLRRAVAAADAQAAVTRVRALGEVVAASESAPRSLGALLLALGALALIIGGVGVYSLIAYIVSWRTREFGIRMALGAQRRRIVREVVRQSLRLALAGSLLGLAASALAGGLLRRFLFGVSPFDPATFAAVALLMILLAVAAAGLPARRAASADPMLALRGE